MPENRVPRPVPTPAPPPLTVVVALVLVQRGERRVTRDGAGRVVHERFVATAPAEWRAVTIGPEEGCR